MQHIVPVAYNVGLARSVAAYRHEEMGPLPATRSGLLLCECMEYTDGAYFCQGYSGPFSGVRAVASFVPRRRKKAGRKE